MNITGSTARLRPVLSVSLKVALIVYPLRAFGAAHAGPILLAATLAMGFTHDSFFSWQFRAWAGLLAASACYVYWNHRQLSRREAWALGIILGSMLLSIPGSVLWGDGHWQITLMVVMWTGPPALLFAVKCPGRVLWWLTPFLVLHALVLASHGLLGASGEWGGRMPGLHINPNPAAALLLVGLVGALCWRHRHWWVLALPFALALPYTGSRWALVVLALVLGMMLLTPHRVRASAVVLIVAASFALAWAVTPEQPARNYRLDGAPTRHAADVELRLVGGYQWGWKDLVGRGYVVPVNDALHHVPMRLSAQYGLPAALAWLVLVGLRLWQRPRRDLRWWLVLVAVLLSQQDYYFIMGQMSGLMWLFLGWKDATRDGNSGRLAVD